MGSPREGAVPVTSPEFVTQIHSHASHPFILQYYSTIHCLHTCQTWPCLSPPTHALPHTQPDTPTSSHLHAFAPAAPSACHALPVVSQPLLPVIPFLTLPESTLILLPTQVHTHPGSAYSIRL